MIGAARLITDRVTFGYLTDVYVLEEHQQRGLGKFLMKCLNEVVEGWPELRARNCTPRFLMPRTSMPPTRIRTWFY